MAWYIVGALLIAITWGLCLWLATSWWIPVTVTAFVVTVLAVRYIVIRVRARRASREIERALEAQAQEHARMQRAEVEADIRALQAQFERAVAALKSSRLGARGAASALYSLPWYVIVGPPGVGKSTALRNSGLEFPFLSSGGTPSVQGVGGTRNCEWWMTPDAVLLDTAGRYTTEDSDREEWLAFLDLLRRYRSRRPINGVMVALSVGDLINGHPGELEKLARDARSRVDELQSRLGVVVPVYFIFTKCDLMPGFVEMFADLRGVERHQIWGYTIPASRQGDIPEQIERHHAELTAVLEKRLLRRLAEERSLDARENMVRLPQYVGGLTEALNAFLSHFWKENIYHETPIIRGVYFSSGTQEGRPIDRIMSSVSEAFGVSPQAAITVSPRGEAKSYFLGELFSRVIFPDWRLARLSRARSRKRRILANTAGGIGVATAAALLWLPMLAFQRNRALIHEAQLGVAYVQQHVDRDTVDAIGVDRLRHLQDVLSTLGTHRDDGVPWPYRFGMYQGNSVYPRTRDVYAATVRKELLLPTVETELAAMQRFVMRYSSSHESPTSEEYEEHFDRLRIYLLVTGPRVPGEPGMSEEERDWLAQALAERWEEPLRIYGDSAPLSRIESVAESYALLLASEPRLVFERDTKLVERVRRVLARTDRSKTIAAALIRSVDGPALKLTDMTNVGAIRNGDRVVRPAFTRAGYEEQVAPRLEGNLEELLDKQWVLGAMGDDADELAERDVEAVMTEYFRQYITEWKTFIDAIYIDAPSDIDNIDTLALLVDLTRTEPYQDIMDHVAWNTQLVDLDAKPRVDEDGNPLLEEVTRIGRQRFRSRARLGRFGVTRRLENAALDQASARLLSDPNAAIVVTDLDVTYAFKGLADFGARKKAAETPTVGGGGPPPPPQSVPLDTYQEELVFVRDALQARMDDPEQQEKLEQRVKSARAKVKQLVSGQRDTGWAPTLEKLLWPPLDLVWKRTNADFSSEVQNKWCNDIVTVFERNVIDSYPFNPSGHDIAMADFNAFFHPENGEIWKYYDAVLKSAYVRRGTRFELVERGESSVGRYRSDVTSYLDAVFELSTVMYPRGEEQSSLLFDVMIEGTPELKEISFTVDGETIKYRNGPEVWGTLKWPGDGPPGAKIEAHGFGREANLEREGDWGLLRVLEHGRVGTRSDPRVFVVQWDFREEGAGIIQMKIRPHRIDTPFFGIGGRRRFMTIFRSRDLVVPRAIVSRAEACRVGKGGRR